jgi:HEAT repeat protein
MLAAAVCLLVAASCTRKPLPKPGSDVRPPRAVDQSDSQGPTAASARRSRPLLPARRTRVEPVPPEAGDVLAILGPPSTPEAAAKQAAELTRQYQNEREFAPRVETVYRLADASSPQSREALRVLFFSEKDPDLRVQMVNSLSFVDHEDLLPSVLILQEALKQTQPRELREAAVEAIQSIHDPRTIPLLQIALSDPDPELRDTASRTIEYFQEVLQRVGR